MRNKYWKKILSLALVLIFAGQIKAVTAFATGNENNMLTAEVNYGEMDSSIEPEIVEEVTSLRTANEKHFRLSDGSYMVMQYLNAVHYKDSDGKWKDIRNSLSTGAYRDQKAYILRAGDISKAFSASGNGNFLFCVERVGCALEICPIGKSIAFGGAESTLPIGETVEHEANQVYKSGAIKGAVSELAYENVFPEATLAYANAGYDTTESIVITSRQDNYSYSFDMNLSGLEIKSGENGDILFNNSYGELQYRMCAPYLVDFAGAVSNAAGYRVTKENEKLVLTIVADSSWMNEKNRIYPVTLSTLFECKPNEATVPLSITHLPQGSSNMSRGPEEDLYFGYSCSNAVNESRICIGFDCFPGLPDTAEIIDAKVRMLQTSYSEVLCDEAEIGIYSAYMTAANDNAKWLRGLTWDSKSSADNLISKTVCSENTTDKLLIWDITDYARQWHGNGGTAKAFVLQLEDVQKYSASHAMIITLEGSRALDMPLLTVRYSADLNEEPPAAEPEENSQRLYGDAAGTVYIGDGDEKIVLESTDLLMGNGGSFSLSQVYKFDSNEWTLSLYETLEKYSLGSSDGIVYTDGIGNEHIYLPTGTDGVYLSTDNESQILVTRETGGEIFELTDGTGYKKRFVNGQLAEYTTPDGETLFVVYNNSTGTDGENRNPQSSENRRIMQLLTGYDITNEPFVLAEFEYENDGTLSRILCCGEETRFEYFDSGNGKKLLSGISSSNGTAVAYQYDLRGLLNRASDLIKQSGIGVTYTDTGDVSRIFDFTLELGGDTPYPGNVITFSEEKQTDMVEGSDMEEMFEQRVPIESIFDGNSSQTTPLL